MSTTASTFLALVFVQATSAYHLPPGLLSAICYIESHHNPKASNPHDNGAGSFGECELKYDTARMFVNHTGPINLMDPKTNVYIAAQYLSYQLDRYNGDIRKAVAAYNAGVYRENRRGLTLNRKYVSKVFKAWVEDK